MSNVHDLGAERERRQLDRAFRNAITLTIDPSELPERLPVTAPGWTIYVEDPAGTEALNYPCETGGDEVIGCLLPAQHEKAVVISALKEALAGLGNPVVDAPSSRGNR